MSNLNKETIEKIKERAKDYALNLTFPLTWSSERVEGARDDAANDHEAGATEWAGKAQELVDALELTQAAISSMFEPVLWNQEISSYQRMLIKTRNTIDNALAKYKEVGNG